MEHHFELHVALHDTDAALWPVTGLPLVGDTEICSNCGTDIGYQDSGKFIPCAVVLNSTDEHFICLPCSAPVIRPKS